MRLRDALLDALAVLLPVECAGCGADDRALCDSCRAALAPDLTVRDVGLPVWAGLRYEGVTRAVMLAFKEQGRVDAARALAPGLAAAVRAALAAAGPGSPVWLVPVPGTRAADRRRGYRPVRVLMARAQLVPARAFAAARPHSVQKGLSVELRDRNLRGTLLVRSPVRGRRILIIDDVVTSGATLREAARVLREAGADVVGAAVVASTPRRWDSAGMHSYRSVTSRVAGTSVARKAS
jgi:ComF family protein